MRSVELFSGAGGLALGVAQAGFTHDAVVEWDKHCCATVRENQQRGLNPVVDWPLYPGDVRRFNFACIPEGVDLLSGGPPCQPFSFGGKHGGLFDPRNMFSEMALAARILRPRAILIENVKGLLRPAFHRWFEYILLQIRYPEIERDAKYDWTDHLARLEQHHTSKKKNGLFYRFHFGVLRATDFGVPQNRERVFLVGFRGDLDIAWRFPNPSHSLDSLLRSKWITGEYWERHRTPRKQRPDLPPRYAKRIERIRCWLDGVSDAPWKTVRDAISDLPDPEKADHSAQVPNHWLNPGARSYQGHTGSVLDEPAKVLKAGNHGVPGGENTLAYSDGRVRYFTVRECARLQTFPDDFVFAGSWTESMRQLGNAVPVELGRVVAEQILYRLNHVTASKRAPSTGEERKPRSGTRPYASAQKSDSGICPPMFISASST